MLSGHISLIRETASWPLSSLSHTCNSVCPSRRRSVRSVSRACHSDSSCRMGPIALALALAFSRGNRPRGSRTGRARGGPKAGVDAERAMPPRWPGRGYCRRVASEMRRPYAVSMPAGPLAPWCLVPGTARRLTGLTIGRPGVWMVAAAGWCWPLPCRACGGGEEDPKSLCGLMDALAPLVLPVRWAGR